MKNIQSMTDRLRAISSKSDLSILSTMRSNFLNSYSLGNLSELSLTKVDRRVFIACQVHLLLQRYLNYEKFEVF